MDELKITRRDVLALAAGTAIAPPVAAQAAIPAPPAAAAARYVCPLAGVLIADKSLLSGTMMYTGEIARRVAAGTGRSAEDVNACWPVPPYSLTFQGLRDAFCTNLQAVLAESSSLLQDAVTHSD